MAHDHLYPIYGIREIGLILALKEFTNPANFPFAVMPY